MSKHTPGPWKARKNGEIGVIDTSDTQSYGVMLVVCRIDEWDFKNQYEANAKLIAAAPDLLAVAEHILAILEHPTKHVTVFDQERLEQCIAKARGEA